MESKALKERIVSILEEKKAKDVVALDVENITVMADSFVICNGTSTTHIKALADEVEHILEKEENLRFNHKEGYNSARWILLDYGDVIVHIFHEEDRKFYDIERLWSDGVVTYNGREL